MSEADAEGNIINAVWSPDLYDIELAFTLTATGQTSGLTAQTTFTDSPKIDTVVVSAQNPSQLCAGGSVSYTVTVNRGSESGATGEFNAVLSITTSLPSGVSYAFSAGSLVPCTTSNQNTCFEAPATIRFGQNDTSLTVALTISTSTSTPGGALFTVRAFKSTNDWADGSGTLTVIANNASCDDGNKCNGIYSCQSGQCTQSAPPVTCSALDQCHDVGTCDTGTGECSNPVKPNGTDCDDGNKCNGINTCQSGTCTQTTAPVICTALDVCHSVGTCDTGTGNCSNPATADGASCDDDTVCNGQETCLARKMHVGYAS